MKMTKSEAGKLGALKTKQKFEELKQQKADEYNKSPSKCANCNCVLEFTKRKRKFCSNSCSASFNNLLRGKEIAFCENCGNEIQYGKKYCNNRCQHEKQEKERLNDWKTKGLFSAAVRRYIFEKFNHSCSKCGLDKWNNLPITLELEHIDGNSENNSEENLTVLCPNCHSQTPTYKAKNKGNGRHLRRVRYSEGKSY